MTTATRGAPRHVAIIMDGNGRWAKRQGFARQRGHSEGAESVREIVRECARRGVEQLTLYAFSSENWRRPRPEVRFLMSLLGRFLLSERKSLMENNLRLRAIGVLEDVPARVRRTLEKTIDLCAANTGMILRLALNYGGRREILDAARRLVDAAKRGELDPNSVQEEDFARFLYDGDMTDPDLLIRTGGEMRLSNFLLWQASYTELYFTRTCWPEFRTPQLLESFLEYARRERRFGGLNEEEAPAAPSLAAQPR